jgi:O-antigen/teichoic acid export membrane protein
MERTPLEAHAAAGASPPIADPAPAAPLPEPPQAAEPHAGPADGEIRGRVLRGVAWKAGSGLSLQLTRFVVAIILAHLLSPRDYGLAGMVLVFSGLIFLFSDLSFGAALIQRERLTEADRSTVFWTSVGVGTALTLLGIAVSPLVADFYGEPSVGPLFAALSVSFLVVSAASTQTALLTREMNFRALEIRNMAGAAASAAVGISLAALGYGAWAIIGQQLTAAATSTVLLIVLAPWRPRFTYSRTSLRSMAGYSGNDFGARVLFFVNRNSDNLLIGRFLGPAELGAYAVSYNIMLLPLAQIGIPMQEVLFPAFSRLQDNLRRMTHIWMRAIRLVAALTIPAMLGLIALAPDFVTVVLGDRWSAAIPVLQILAWVGLLQSLQGLNGSVLRALGRTQTLFRYSIVVALASLAAFAIGLRWGIVGVAAAYAISSTFVEPYYSWLTTRALGSSPWKLLLELRGVIESTAIMLAVILPARYLMIEAGIRPGVRLPVLMALGALVYLAACRWRAPVVIREVRDLRRRRVRQRAAAS